MKKELGGVRNQLSLFPPAIDDLVPPDHPARFLDEVVDSLDLREMGLVVPPASRGRPRYAPDVLVKVILYSYFRKVRSFRQMERECRENLIFIWLTGGVFPDHNTLWRFWKEHEEALCGLLKGTVRVALKAGLVGFTLHAVDGTKIRARASLTGAVQEKELRKLLAAVDASIEEMRQALADPGQGEGNPTLPAELQDAESRRRIIQESFRELKEKHTKALNRSEPDARLMKTTEGVRFAYNAQAVVDEQSGLVVGEDVITDANDTDCLAAMTSKVEETAGKTAEVTVADKGYWSAEQLAKAERSGHKVLVSIPKNADPDPGKEPFHPTQFRYDPESGKLVCPLGQKMRFRGYRRGRWRGEVREYVCPVHANCPRRTECCGGSNRGRVIRVHPDRWAQDLQRERQRERSAKKHLSRRKAVVEPVFARIKEIHGLRRWSFRRLQGVKAQWAVVCAAYNLRKLYAFWCAGELQLA